MTLDRYIDIHTHILPEVDDGSRSMEETIQMLQIAIREGIGGMIATPHYACGADNKSVEQLRCIRDQVQEEALKIDKDFELFLGNELYYSDSIVEALSSKKALTLAGSRYVLVEFSVKETYKTMYKGLREFILAGYAPILAHVERYFCLQKKDHLIKELVELGTYIQMNNISLLGGFLNAEASYNRKLLNKGLVHLIGSDCHDEKMRVPQMKNTVKIVSKNTNDRLVDQIFLDNPRKILENKYI